MMDEKTLNELKEQYSKIGLNVDDVTENLLIQQAILMIELIKEVKEIKSILKEVNKK